jgi:S1-C subfamily serine protease
MVDYGYITSDGYVEYLTDSSIELFTTSLLHSHTEEGIVADTDGRVIGIITRVLGGSVKADINKCMKVNSIIMIAEKLCNGGNMVYCGINLENIPSWVLRENELENGIYVNSVEASSPASDAGIRKGDIITAIDGTKTNDASTMTEKMAQRRPNDRVTISYNRNGIDKKVEVTLKNKVGKAEPVTVDTKDVAEALGGKFSEVSQSMREKLEIRGGVQVTSVDRDGLLGRSGVKEGFVITYINDRPVTSMKDLQRMSDSIESIDGVYPNGRALRYVIVK